MEETLIKTAMMAENTVTIEARARLLYAYVSTGSVSSTFCLTIVREGQ